MIVASNGGSSTHPAWYYNLKFHPRVKVELGTETFHVVAEELDPAARSLVWPTIVEQSPAAGEFQRATIAARALPDSGRHCRLSLHGTRCRRHRLEPDRRAVRAACRPGPLTRDRTEQGGRSRYGSRPGGGSRHGRVTGRDGIPPRLPPAPRRACGHAASTAPLGGGRPVLQRGTDPGDH
jgi:F420H(2)-dependent quinone reductase